MPDATILSSRGHQPPQRRHRPRSAAAIRQDRFIHDRFIQRRVRLRHSPRPHTSGTRSGRKMAIDECSGPPGLRFRIEPAGPARQTLRRSLVYGPRLQLACFPRRRPAQCSLCRVAREHSVYRRRPELKFYSCFCAQISCYRTLSAFIQLSVPVSRSSSVRIKDSGELLHRVRFFFGGSAIIFRGRLVRCTKKMLCKIKQKTAVTGSKSQNFLREGDEPPTPRYARG